MTFLYRKSRQILLPFHPVCKQYVLNDYQKWKFCRNGWTDGAVFLHFA